VTINKSNWKEQEHYKCDAKIYTENIIQKALMNKVS